MSHFEEEVFKDFNFVKNEENSESKIKEVEEQFNIIFPIEYSNIFKKYDGGSGNIGSYYIDMWSLEDIIEFYENTGEIDDLIIFASDGCGMAYAFRKNDMKISMIPMDSLEYEYSKICSDNFYKLIQDMYFDNVNEY